MKILVPIDFSEASKKGVALAIQFKKRNPDFTIHSLYTIQPSKVKSRRLAQKMKELEEQEEIMSYKKELKDFFGSDLKKFDKHIIDKGDTAKTIYRRSHDKNYDLVIMGTKGANVAKEVFIGTKAFEFLTMTQKPVIIVPQKWEEHKVEKCCISLKLDQMVSPKTSQLVNLVDALGLRTKLISAVDDCDENIKPSLKIGKSDYRIELIKSSKPVLAIKEFIENRAPDMLALKYHTHTFVDSMLQSSFTNEFAFRSKQPILFIK